MNANNFDWILPHLTQAESADDLAVAVAHAMQELKPDAQWILLKYRPGSHPLSVLFSNSKRMPKAQELVPQAFATWSSYYLDDTANSGNAYLLFGSAPHSDKEKAILDTWQHLLRFGHSFGKTENQTIKADCDHQFSQMLHDVEALIDLFQNPEADREAVLQRIRYQKRLNKRLLFYNQEPELLPVRIAIGELLQACLQKRHIDPAQLPIAYVELQPEQSVEIDVELFDQAFAEILQNALTATENDWSKIHIEVHKRTDAFHFVLKEWLIVSIMDKGRGINPDFLEWVTMPYFTTWKAKGHTGFGLSIAQKILKAHQGFLEIFSTQGSGTTVNMFLPRFNDDAKK